MIDDQGRHYQFEGFDAGNEALHPVRLDFGQILTITSIHLSLESLDEKEPAHVHLWDVVFE